jgi:hypothetical protein
MAKTSSNFKNEFWGKYSLPPNFCEGIYLSDNALMFASSVWSNSCSYYQAHTKTKEKPFA